jgi:hypothetical protein
MSHHTTIIATTNGNNNNITNFHHVLKMIADYKELVLKLLFVHKRRFAFGSLQETFKFRFGYDLDQKIVGYENVHKLLEAMLEFVWI